MSPVPAELPQWGVSGASLADNAYGAIREKIVLLRIPPGDPISEAELAAELKVGRTPIREALKRLELDHLVVSFPRRGTFAASVDVGELASITELRCALEPVAARTAADRAADQQRQVMKRAAEGIREFADDLRSGANLSSAAEAFLRLDTLVHHSIYSACGNDHLAEVLARYHYLAMRVWALAAHRLPDIIEHAEEHIPLLDAIISGDGDEAWRMTVTHIERFERSLREIL